MPSRPVMEKIRIIGFFFENKGYNGQSAVQLLLFISMSLRLNLSTTADLQFYKPQHCTVLDWITGNFKAS